MSRPLYLSYLSILLVLILNVINVGAEPLPQGGPPTVSIGLDKPIECSIDAGETHSYTLNLSSNQYAHVTVDQRGVDLVVTVAETWAKHTSWSV